MKYLFKQIWLYIGLVLIAAAVAGIVIGSKQSPDQSILSRMEKFYNSGKKADFLKCVTREDKEAAEARYELSGFKGLEEKETYRLLKQRTETDPETGSKVIHLTLVLLKDGEFVSAESAVAETKNVKGTDYLIVK